MSITKQNPRTVHLGGRITVTNVLVASEAITPGHLVERFDSSGTQKWRKHSTAAGFGQTAFALDQPELNKGLDDAYAVGDLAAVGIALRGATVYALLASGQNITNSDMLESTGNGTVRKFGAGTRFLQALESVDNSTGLTAVRIRAEAL